MFGIGGFELFIILVFGFLIFGPEKLPDIARTVGRGIARFRQAQDEVNDVIKSTDIYDPNDLDEPFKDPVQALDKIAQRQEEKRKSATEKSAASSADASQASGSAGKASDEGKAAAPRQESFTERKARYERERAARKAAEEAAAQGDAKPEPQGGDAPASEAQASGVSAGGDE